MPETRQQIKDLIFHTSKVCRINQDVIWKKCYDNFEKATFVTLRNNKLDIIELHNKMQMFFRIVKDVCMGFEINYRQTNYDYRKKFSK
mgnify:CR=1 FL=1